MSINSTYFLNAADLASATAVYLDSLLSLIAPDDFYSNEIISRQQLGGVLLPAEVCDCGDCLDCVSGLPILIGTQEWTNCNLDVITYSNGDPIPEVTDAATWEALTTGAWCYYDNDPANGPTYGKLYNWYAVNDPRGLAPVGYHVPSDAELTTLTTYLGGALVAGGAMKEAGLCHWLTPNTDATDSSGFTALPGGYRAFNGTFNSIGSQGTWWSSSETGTTSAWYRNLNYNSGDANRDNVYKKGGFSVRLIKDDDCPNCTPQDVTIDSQIWTGCNLNVATYRNGDTIPQVTDPTAWSNLTTGAWCYYDNDPANEAIYGKLYNWYAVNDARGLAPTGYHVPSDSEWTILTTFLGGDPIAGGPMKEAGLCHWGEPNTDATNESNFTGLPGGYRFYNGTFFHINDNGLWWSSSEYNTNYSRYRLLYNNSGIIDSNYNYKTYGMSVRLIKDDVS